MNLFNKIQGQYDQLWKYIIRPNRTPYTDAELGPQIFTLENIKVKRNSFQLINDRGQVFYGSHFVPLESNSYPCLIYLHGNSSNQTQGMQYLSSLIKNNISLCTFDFAGCGNSQGQFVTLGYNQYKDVEEVVMSMKAKQKVTKIAVWGRSMGAVTALRYVSRHPDVTAAIYDSPFKSLKSLIGDLCKKNTKVPMFILQGALKIIAGTIKQKAKFDIYDLDPLKTDAPIIQVPGFFIVSQEDQLIPYEHTQILHEAYKSKNKYIRIVKGEHNGTRPDACIVDAIKFLKKQLFKADKQNKQIKTPQQPQQSAKVEQIDFFNEDLLETNVQQSPMDKKPSQREEIDFFEEYEKNQGEIDDMDFKSFENSYQSHKKSDSSSIFSLNDIFAGVFTSKQKKPKQIHDGYEELRAKVSQISILKGSMSKESLQLIQKQMKSIDNTFEKMFTREPQQYIW